MNTLLILILFAQPPQHTIQEAEQASIEADEAYVAVKGLTGFIANDFNDTLIFLDDSKQKMYNKKAISTSNGCTLNNCLDRMQGYDDESEGQQVEALAPPLISQAEQKLSTAQSLRGQGTQYLSYGCFNEAYDFFKASIPYSQQALTLYQQANAVYMNAASCYILAASHYNNCKDHEGMPE